MATTKAKAKRKGPPKRRSAQQREAIYVAEYVKDGNGSRAAVCAGYSPHSARYASRDLLARPDIRDAIDKLAAEKVEKVGLEVEQIMHDLNDMARADANELIQLRRGACRYCHGLGHRYHRTPREREEALADFEEMKRKLLREAETEVEKEAIKRAPFDEAGGVGYDPRKDPHRDCPECFGDGEQRIVAMDTRDLSPAARKLYAGVKVTKEGFEIKTHDAAAARMALARAKGMFKLEVTGKGGGAITHTHEHSVAAILQDIALSGADTGIGKAASRR